MMVCAIPECYRRCFEKSGVVHDFCSRRHAQEAADRGMIHPLQPPHGVCHVRSQRERHTEREADVVVDISTYRHVVYGVYRSSMYTYIMRSTEYGVLTCHVRSTCPYIYLYTDARPAATPTDIMSWLYFFPLCRAYRVL